MAVGVATGEAVAVTVGTAVADAVTVGVPVLAVLPSDTAALRLRDFRCLPLENVADRYKLTGRPFRRKGVDEGAALETHLRRKQGCASVRTKLTLRIRRFTTTTQARSPR